MSNNVDSVVEWHEDPENGRNIKNYFPEYSRSFDKKGNLVYGSEIISWGSVIYTFNSLNLLIESDYNNSVDTLAFKYKFVSDSLILYRFAQEVNRNVISFRFTPWLHATFQFNKNGRLILATQWNYKTTSGN